MARKKPTNVSQYVLWLKRDLDVDISRHQRTRYEAVSKTILRDFQTSKFWGQISSKLVEYDSDYLASTGYHLLMDVTPPPLHIKPFDSFLLKTFRKNVLDHPDWPNEPKDGWILPTNWYTRINDIVRTVFAVKYLDGVEFLISKIKLISDEIAIDCHIDLEAKEEGYYAGHVYPVQDFEIPKIDWDTEHVDVMIELQITTQLQEVIRNLLHRYYEIERKKVKRETTVKWQWDYRSDEFSANYLGHILHYIEGMIMEIRDKKEEDQL